MTANRIAIGLIAVWAALFLAGFLHFLVAAPTGEGFVRGLNRVVAFVLWEAAALVPAVSLLVTVARHGPAVSDPIRRLAHLPIAASGLVALTVAGMVLWAVYTP